MEQVPTVFVGDGFCQPVSPNRWQGETDCLVGPFSSRQVAEHFIRPTVDFGHYHIRVTRVFAKGDAWYVEIDKLNIRRNA